ncbi:MAG TPA: transporter [Candidatus Omnitrophota bacterium]|nr:transporter [Candidatus Omnitrophota bacterium]HRY85472.1 transporter [Candidatus Omnitrophota bacterium]
MTFSYQNFKAAVFLITLLYFWPVLLYATHADENIVMEEHSKVMTTDATPNDPGQVEVWTSYAVQGGKFDWLSDGERKNRGTYLAQSWETQITLGVYNGIDIGIIGWFQHTLDKSNNYNEFRDMMDPDTGGVMEDTTEGPTHGFGWGDLGVTGHWRFYDSAEKKLEISYIPLLFVPTGRRSNLDHIGASQGYTSLDNSLAFTKDVGRWNGTLNLGYNSPLAHWERTGHYYGTGHVNFAVGCQVLSWLQPEAELIYQHDFGGHGMTANLFSVVVGLIMPFGDHVRAEMGVQQDVLGSNKIQTTSGIFSLAFLT